MLGKCLSPKCSAQFRYMNEGKLFCLTKVRTQGQARHVEVEYYWICNQCALFLIPTRGPEGKIDLRPLVKDNGRPQEYRCAARSRQDR